MRALLVGYKLPSIFQRIFIFSDCHFYVANGMLSQLIRVSNLLPTDTFLYFKPAFLESRRHTSILQASIFPGTIVYYTLRDISETYPHLPIDNAIGSTSFIIRCFLHIGTAHVLFFFIKCSLFHCFQASAENATPM